MPGNNASSSATLTLPEDCGPQTADRSEYAVEDGPRIRVLFISPNREDHATLRRVLEGLPCEILTVANCRQAAAQLGRERISVVFCESLLEDGTWKNVLGEIQRYSNPPLLIVASRQADEQLWAEVLNLGGYDVVAEPLNPREVRHILTTASIWLKRSSVTEWSAASS
jgi:DNA-binding NtrC family response regulator